MNESYRDLEALKNAPSVRTSSWMSDGLDLKGKALTVFALLFEREHLGGERAREIDSAYISRAAGASEVEVMQTLTQLTNKGYLRLNLGAASFLDGFTVDVGRVLEALAPSEGQPQD